MIKLFTLTKVFKKSALMLLTVFFILVTENTIAKEIFVSAAATTAGDGTITNPYKTILEAVTVAVSGDVITIREGTYREEVKMIADGITYQGYPGEKVIINGTEQLTNWTAVAGGSVYQTIMNFDAPRNSLDYPSNQLFVDKKMIELVRWPKQTSTNICIPTDAIADAATSIGGFIVTITDSDFDQPDGRWVGASVWVNLSRGALDGQGWTGKVVATNLAAKTISINFRETPRLGNQPWSFGLGTEYHLFNPTKEGLNATGGINAILGENEWWKTDTILYVRTSNGLSPSNIETGTNILEAKKREFAFVPSGETQNRSFYTIKNLSLFASTITTDVKFRQSYRDIREDAQNILLENIDAKYVSHTKSHISNWQEEFYGRSGIIVSGRNNVIRNCIIQYSVGPAICLLGANSKALNNTLTDINYGVTNAGALCLGSKCIDGEVAYNTISNTASIAINFAGLYNSNAKYKGVARIHHNKIYDFQLRSNDSGAINDVSSFGNWARIDHNHIYKTFNTTRSEQDVYGIYFDFNEGSYLTDHNLVHGLRHGILINKSKNILVYNNTLISNKLNEATIIDATGGNGLTDTLRNNILSYVINQPGFSNLGLSVRSNNITNAFGPAVQNTLFTNVAQGNFTLLPTATAAIDQGVNTYPFKDPVTGSGVDIGAFEYGIPAWVAGKSQILPPTITPSGSAYKEGDYLTSATVTIKSDTVGNNVSIRYTLNGAEPTLTSTLYTQAFTINDTTIVKAKIFINNIAASEFSSINIAVTQLENLTPVTVNFDSPVSGTSFIGRAFIFISSPNPNVIIRYTLDGTTPNENSLVYFGLLDLRASATVKVIAFGKWINSPVTEATYTILSPTITISPNGGNIDQATTVTITKDFFSGSIFYTLDGSTPTVASLLYTSPITITNSIILKAVNIFGGIASEVKTAEFIVTNRVVSILPNGGTLIDNTNVSLTSQTAGVTIYYTTNGDTPTTSSTLYSQPFNITTTTTIKAIAVLNDVAGAVYTATITITGPNVNITPNGGSFSDVLNVTLASPTAGSSIYYTTDGSNPTSSSTLYSGPISVNSFTTTIKAVAIRNNKTGVQKEAIFTITKPTLTISPNGIKSEREVKVTLTTSLPASVIYYTLDGTEPNASSLVYSEPLVLKSNTTVKAFSAKGTLISDVKSAFFDINIDYNQLLLYPNPVNGGQFKIRFNWPFKGQVIQVIIFDASGRLVHKRNIKLITSEIIEEDFNLPYLKPGTYIVKVNTISAHVSDLLNEELKLVIK